MSHNITQLVERALRKHILDALPSWCDETRVYRGIENRDAWDAEGPNTSVRVLPCITVTCRTADPMLPWRGNWTAHCEVMVESHASDTTGDQHDARAAEVFDRFLLSDAPIEYPEFWQGMLQPGQQSIEVADGRFISTQAFDLIACCPASMS